jgi:hypothetical protein
VSALDRFGRTWPGLTASERCPDCGQPDNSGDCTHSPLSPSQVTLLGGLLIGEEACEEGEHDYVTVMTPYGPDNGPCADCGAEPPDPDGPCCRAVVTSGDPHCHEPGCYNDRSVSR